MWLLLVCGPWRLYLFVRCFADKVLVSYHVQHLQIWQNWAALKCLIPTFRRRLKCAEQKEMGDEDMHIEMIPGALDARD